MHKNAKGHSRKEIVQQVKKKNSSVHDYGSYIPIGNAVEKLKNWKKQGAEILYLTSRGKTEEVKKVKDVLKKHCFPDGELFFRQLFHKKSKEYARIVEEIKPDIFIEDDCESIWGEEDMTITYVSPEIKKKINSFAVKEFGGIDFLPDNLSEI